MAKCNVITTSSTFRISDTVAVGEGESPFPSLLSQPLPLHLEAGTLNPARIESGEFVALNLTATIFTEYQLI